MLSCPYCQFVQKNLEKILFRTSCEKCNTPLHSCLNCRYYKGACLLPGTESVREPSSANFCEEFTVKSPQEKVISLPGGFNDLFK